MTAEGEKIKAASPDSRTSRSEIETLPITLGLCPVHHGEFYYPVSAKESERPLGCPVCDEELVLYHMSAAVEVVGDINERLIMFDGGPELMSWYDRHRLHRDEPYIGCPFCRDQFERVA